MTFTLEVPCYNCSKKDDCSDEEKLNKTVDNLVYDDNHKGAGVILMSCFNMQK